MELSRSFAGTPAGARAARHFVGDALTGFADELCATVVLLTSELATNAVLHARGSFVVSVQHLDDGVRVSVRDGSSELPQRHSVPGDATSGRGLQLVDSLARVWGIDAREAGKVVWFEIGLGRVSLGSESRDPAP
jgi:anti-sigma regulatory factor (Ser/Thr protein kinase)